MDSAPKDMACQVPTDMLWKNHQIVDRAANLPLCTACSLLPQTLARGNWYWIKVRGRKKTFCIGFERIIMAGGDPKRGIILARSARTVIEVKGVGSPACWDFHDYALIHGDEVRFMRARDIDMSLDIWGRADSFGKAGLLRHSGVDLELSTLLRLIPALPASLDQIAGEIMYGLLKMGVMVSYNVGCFDVDMMRAMGLLLPAGKQYVLNISVADYINLFGQLIWFVFMTKRGAPPRSMYRTVLADEVQPGDFLCASVTPPTQYPGIWQELFDVKLTDFPDIQFQERDAGDCVVVSANPLLLVRCDGTNPNGYGKLIALSFPKDSADLENKRPAVL